MGIGLQHKTMEDLEVYHCPLMFKIYVILSIFMTFPCSRCGRVCLSASASSANSEPAVDVDNPLPRSSFAKPSQDDDVQIVNKAL